MARARVWTCRKCRTRNPRTKRTCAGPACAGRRPAPRRPAHAAILTTMPYEEWVARFGELCGICGRGRTGRRLDRDHDHRTGAARGILCHRCNRALPDWMDATWLRNAANYLDRAGAA